MKSLLLAVLVSLSFSAQAGIIENREFNLTNKKAEPAPKDRDERTGNSGGEGTPGHPEETYEGNERDGGEFDGGGYDDGSEGGMIGELFSAPIKLQLLSVKTVTEDRGSFLVVTTTRSRDAYEGDTCAYVTVQIVDKKSGDVQRSDSINTCDNQVL